MHTIIDPIATAAGGVFFMRTMSSCPRLIGQRQRVTPPPMPSALSAARQFSFTNHPRAVLFSSTILARHGLSTLAPIQTSLRKGIRPRHWKKKKAGWWPLLRETGPLSTFALPKGEGTFVVDIQGREILIKGHPKILKKAVPLWMRAVPGQRHVYDISTIKTKNDHFIEVSRLPYWFIDRQQPTNSVEKLA